MQDHCMIRVSRSSSSGADLGQFGCCEPVGVQARLIDAIGGADAGISRDYRNCAHAGTNADRYAAISS
jgi:hypothetical protein